MLAIGPYSRSGVHQDRAPAIPGGARSFRRSSLSRPRTARALMPIPSDHDRALGEINNSAAGLMVQIGVIIVAAAKTCRACGNNSRDSLQAFVDLVMKSPRRTANEQRSYRLDPWISRHGTRSEDRRGQGEVRGDQRVRCRVAAAGWSRVPGASCCDEWNACPIHACRTIFSRSRTRRPRDRRRRADLAPPDR